MNFENAFELFEKNPLKNTNFPFLAIDINHKRSTSPRTHFQQLHWHEDLQIVYVLDGNIKINTLNKSIILKTNEAAMINENVLHMIIENDTAHYRSLLFPKKLISFFENSIMDENIRHLLHNRQFELYEFNNSKEKSIINEINELYFNKTNQCFIEYKITCLLTNLIYEVLTHISLPSNNLEYYQYDNIQKCVGFIHLHYQDKITLEDIASFGNLSIGHCGRLFKKILHTTPYEYLINYRINKSIELLKNENNNITDIALLVGFSDTSHYIQCFKKKTNVTPKQYQKQLFNR